MMDLQNPIITMTEKHGYMLDDLAFMDTDGWVDVEEKQTVETCAKCGVRKCTKTDDYCAVCLEA